MLFRKKESGMTIIELLVTMVMIAILSPLILGFFWSAVNNFLKIQTTAALVSKETQALTRIEQVLRGGTQITNATATSLTIYAYFSPADSTLSQVTYTYDAPSSTIKVDQIPASGTAPNYTYNQSDKKTITILSGVKLKNSLFTYEDAIGGTGPFDNSTYQNIKMINIDIYGTVAGNTATTQVKSSVLLRNRRVNF